ncbi:hypothetical protein ACH42_07935 [Endozoicomonas sp. (ex Bugula neritina AB1)]|nr:hypothetical protein ACH42_07935 [Endozoicomonas sp. (ex Bugula neritina AB1)]
MKVDSLQQPINKAGIGDAYDYPLDKSILLCPDCDLLIKRSHVSNIAHKCAIYCPKCNRILREYHPNGLIKTLSWVITGGLLFIPANIFPVLIMEILGRQEQGTIWDGVTGIYSEGLQGVAALVFLVAMVIPFMRLMVLFCVLMAAFGYWKKALARPLFRWYLHLGEWGMVEIYLLGILISVVKLADMATVYPGVGLFCLVGLMVAELGISVCMDEQAVWEGLEE